MASEFYSTGDSELTSFDELLKTHEGKSLAVLTAISYGAGYLLLQKVFNGELEMNPTHVSEFFGIYNLFKFCVWYGVKTTIFWGGSYRIGQVEGTKSSYDWAMIRSLVRKVPRRLAEVIDIPDIAIDRTKEDIKQFANTNHGFFAFGVRLGLKSVDLARNIDLVDRGIHFARKVVVGSIESGKGMYDAAAAVTIGLPAEMSSHEYAVYSGDMDTKFSGSFRKIVRY